jgi:hypothetical protein
MTEKKPTVVCTATHDSAAAAEAGLDAIEQLPTACG